MRFEQLITLLLAHHHPEDYDRCTFVAGVPICRRCLFLYPATFLIMGLQFTPLRFPDSLNVLLMGLAVPATLDFILERSGALQYHPARVIIGSLLLSLPLGMEFARYLENRWDPEFWGFILVFGIPAVTAALHRAWRDIRNAKTKS